MVDRRTLRRIGYGIEALATQALGRATRTKGARPAFYRLRDETHETIFVGCSKCWKAAFEHDALISSHDADFNMVELLGMLSAPSCSKFGHHWDRCGAYYVEPIDNTRAR